MENMNILDEISELKNIFINFFEYIEEDKFSKIDSKDIDLRKNIPCYYFTILDNTILNVLENRLTRLNLIFHLKNNELSSTFHKKLNTFFTKSKYTLEKKSFFDNKNDFIDDIFNDVDNIYLITLNVYDLHFKEKEKIKHINIGNFNNTGNFTLENYGTQNIQNINNEIDKIIGLLESKNISNKEELKKLLEEFKKTQDKTKLEKVLTNLASVSGIGSLITSIIALL